MYINGDFVKAKSGKTRDIINPANGKVMATVPEAQSEDVFEAITAAREAFDGQEWSSKTALERQDLMFALAQKIRDKFDFFVELETQNNGKPKREAEFDIDDSINCLKFYAGLATKIHGETMSVPANSFSFVTREPIGVCAQIIPWNFPFLMLVWKIAPALITGNTVVLKPSEITPLTALEFAKCFDEVGFPKGVLNIITGDGTVAGNALISDTRIDKIAFTGGTNTGKHIAKIAAENLKKVTLELGGKNPVIIFDDANLDLTIDWALFAAFANSGQVCTAGSRLLVHADIYDVFVQKFVEGAKKIKLGDGLLAETTMGPVVSKAHFDKIMNYIQIGKSEANLAFGGNGDSENGYFIVPTIFVDVKPSGRIAKEEIFGPVVAIMKFESEEEAIHLANDTEYGLGFGIFTQNITRVHRISPKIKAGIGWVNWYHPTFNEMPWGGYKQSGTGRELGLYGIENYLEVKQVNINLDTDPVGWYS
ncbi:aldehyde dehydrogenase family protein [Nubsella zeaxanthinifaciens]|uniref:aldehyde dehydrogenase family protein n=1 Tax=Nubsella zeaxanthinifaciens TaxID=392412 RepID=UPI003D049871